MRPAKVYISISNISGKLLTIGMHLQMYLQLDHISQETLPSVYCLMAK